jgi:hypothetical protein
VLTAENKTPSQFILIPTGAGEPRKITNDQIDHLAGRFLPDGKHIIFIGRETGHAARIYLFDLGGGTTKTITPEGVTGRALAPDGKHFVAKSKGSWATWSIEGGDPVPIAGLQNDDMVFGYTGDARQLYIGRPEESRPRKVYLFDVATRKRTLWKSLGPQDLTGASTPGIPVISVDGKHYAYQVVRSLSDLYVVDGLK